MNPPAPSGPLDIHPELGRRIKQAAPVGRRIKQEMPADRLIEHALPVGHRIKQVTPADRRSKITHGRWYMRSSAAAVGGLALIIASIGAVSISGQEGMLSPNGDYQALDLRASASNNNVSRDFDRASLNELIESQVDEVSRVQQKLESIAEAKADAKAEAKAEELKAKQGVLPVKDYRITGRFGTTNSTWGNGHSGLDFAGPSGSTIMSIAAGTVITANYSGNCGNMTKIQLDAEDLVVKYCHQSRLAVKPGQQVQAGETIGYIGSTGRSTGPHLHLEIAPGGGRSVDPELFFRKRDLTP